MWCVCVCVCVRARARRTHLSLSLSLSLVLSRSLARALAPFIADEPVIVGLDALVAIERETENVDVRSQLRQLERVDVA